jgi:hypothetical protein
MGTLETPTLGAPGSLPATTAHRHPWVVTAQHAREDMEPALLAVV